MSTRRRARQSPWRAAAALCLCLVVGVGGGIAVTMSTEPDASAAVVTGAVEDSLGVEAADALRTAYEAARSGDRTRPPAGIDEAGAAPEVSAAPETSAAPEPSAAPETSADVLADAADVRSAGPEPSRSPSARPDPAPQEGSGLLGRDVAVEPRLSGKLVVAEGRSTADGSSAARSAGTVWRVQVAVEKGLPVDAEVFADAVFATLNDPRGWNAADGSTFVRTDSDSYDARVVLASPGTTDELCLPLDTIGELSCGIAETAVLNFKRWAKGSQAWENTAHYRQYLVNHEVGHVIGYRHDLCAGDGEHATVMVQQTTTTSGCIPEPWPVPDRAD